MYYLANRSTYKTVAETGLPITVAEVKDYLRLNTGTAEDTLLTSLITAATQYVQDVRGVQMMPATWQTVFNRSDKPDNTFFPDYWEVALWPTPISAVTSIQYRLNGTLTTWPTTEYSVSLSRRRPVIRPKTIWPSVDFFAVDPLIVTYTSGYSSASAVPEMWKLILKSLVGVWYENREGVQAGGLSPVPFHLDALLSGIGSSI